MSTSTIWDDSFGTYTLGPGHPTNWYDPGGDTSFVDFGTMTGHSQAPGFYEQSGHGLNLAGDQIYFIDTNSNVQSAQFVWLSWNSIYNVQCFNVNLSTFAVGTFPGQGQTLLACTLNSDYTMQLSVTSTLGAPVGVYPIACTTQQVFFQNVWQAWQLDVATGEVIVLGTSYLTVSGTLSLEGTAVCQGTTTTGIMISSLYTGEPIINEYSFGGGPGAIGYLANFTGITGTPLPPFGTWPHPGVPDAFYTQGVAEYMGMPDSTIRAARVTQGANEIISVPSSVGRYARMTQGVVEIIRKVIQGAYWMVYET